MTNEAMTDTKTTIQVLEEFANKYAKRADFVGLGEHAMADMFRAFARDVRIDLLPAILAQQAATPADAPHAGIRAFEERLNELRQLDVSQAFHEIVEAAKLIAAEVAAQQPAKSAEALPLARPGRWRDGDACDEGQPAKSEAAQHATEATRNQGMSDAEINEITTASLGKWPSFKAQSWACKVAHAVLSHATQLEQKVGLTFEQAWAEKEAQGYNYGEDALENVRLGFEMARATPSATVDVAASGEAVAWRRPAYPDDVRTTKVERDCWVEEGWEVESLCLQTAATSQSADSRLGAGVASVPEGYALVPIEPTPAMIDAYLSLNTRFHSARSDWAAMVAAAPAPTAPDDVARIYLGRLRNGSTTWLEFTMEAWDKLDTSWERAIGASQFADAEKP